MDGLHELDHLALLLPGPGAHPALRRVTGLVLQTLDALGQDTECVLQDHQTLLGAELKAVHGSDAALLHHQVQLE